MATQHSTMGEAAATVEPQGSAPRGETLLRVTNMAKAFGPTQALRDCTFELRAGEVHALVGENGSGKSTLVKILSGVHAPDEGTIELGGETLGAMPNPRVAQANGIVTVFQEVLVAEARSVLDNVWLGADNLLTRKVPTGEKRERATAALQQLVDGSIRLDDIVEDLSLSDRQSCCLVRALLRNPRVLILDEATSALDIATRTRLFEAVKQLTAQGVGVIFITHRMDEIDEIADRMTIMRSGETKALLERGKWSSAEIVRHMTGSDQLTGAARDEADPINDRAGAPVISVKHLTLGPDRTPIDLSIRAGELVGVAGLEGHGQADFLEALWGGAGIAGETVRHTDAGDVLITSPKKAAANDIAYVPRERGLDALFRWMSIRENFAIPTLKRDKRRFLLSPRATRKRLEKYIDELGIVLGSVEDPITTLSGGNQQKVIIARWLASEPRVLLLNDPTRGIDVNAKRDLYHLLTRLASEGLAVVMLSTELDEHVELMDRVLVFREHELVAEIPRAKLTRNALLANFFGEHDQAEPTPTTPEPKA
jgi:ABC-type sugar transport system ATPase subunit